MAREARTFGIVRSHMQQLQGACTISALILLRDGNS